MGISLMADGSPLPGRLRGLFSLKKLAAKLTVSYGPYSCRFVPLTGADRATLPGHLIDADHRVYFPAAAPVAPNDTIRRVETNQAWTVVFVNPLGAELECWAKRSVVPAAGTK